MSIDLDFDLRVDQILDLGKVFIDPGTPRHRTRFPGDIGARFSGRVGASEPKLRIASFVGLRTWLRRFGCAVVLAFHGLFERLEIVVLSSIFGGVSVLLLVC